MSMKDLIMSIIRFAGVVVAGLVIALSQAQAANMAAVNEVLKLKAAGLSEESMVAFVQSKDINYDLSADDTVWLSKQGVTSTVLNAMLASGKGAPSPAVALPVPGNPPAAAAPQPAPGLPPAVAAQPALSPEAAYFYQELSPYGRWTLAEDGQWYWQPTEVVNNPGWRPYWDRGHWVYTDSGWYWASDYPWGWAGFHYGRWQLHPHHGWIWLPDRVWAPAWVAWRSGGEYCGWAPLPPGAVFDARAGRFSFHGRPVEASFDFGLDWLHFNFSLVREMGEQPRARFRKEQEARAIFHQTTIINTYGVKNVVENNQTRVQVVNRGIDPGRVSNVKGRALETIKIQDLRTPAPKGTHERFDRQAKTLEVYRPRLGEGPKR
jgi:hypothetical protein